MICNICCSANTINKYDNLTKCKNCGSEFIDPQPSDARLTEIYSKEYYNSWGLEDSMTRKMKYDTATNHLKKIANFYPSGSILDVGCAFGFLLEAARDIGYEPFGIEFSEHSSSIAKQKFGSENIFNGRIEDSPFPKNKFNIISMFDLIEHTRNPKEALQDAMGQLASKGIVLISTPNVNSLSRILMRKKWIHYKEEHLFYFSNRGMRMLAESLDLKIVKTQQFKKVFYLSYVLHQFEIYNHFFLTPFFKMLNYLLPNFILNKPFSLAIGEMFVVLQKKN